MFSLADDQVSNETWQAALQDRLLDMMECLNNPAFIPPGLQVSLQTLVPLEDKTAMFNVVVAGKMFPLNFTFQVFPSPSDPDVPFCAMPVSPAFVMKENSLPEGYVINSPSYEATVMPLIMDLMANYLKKVNGPEFDPHDARLWRVRNILPVPC